MLGFTFAAFGNQDMNRGKVLLQGGLTSESTQAIVKIGAPKSTSYECRLGVHVMGIATSGGGTATLEVSRSSSTDFSAAATTMYSFTCFIQ